jgi:hypothetical protein
MAGHAMLAQFAVAMFFADAIGWISNAVCWDDCTPTGFGQSASDPVGINQQATPIQNDGG